MRTINQSEFKQLFPYERQLTLFIGEGVEWFTDDTSDVIGIIGQGFSQKIWSYAILKRGQLGYFVVSNVGEYFFNIQMVRSNCLLACDSVIMNCKLTTNHA